MRVFRVALPLAASVFLASCGVQESIDDATAQVSTFHAELDAGEYGLIWGDTSPEFRKVSKRVAFDKLLTAIHKKLGNVKQSQQVGWKTNATTSGTFVTLQMNTTFEKGSGDETFNYIRKGDGLELAGYFINSNDMMIN